MPEALPSSADLSAGLPPLVGGRFRPRERFDSRGKFERWAADESAGIGPVVLLSEPENDWLPDGGGPPWPGLAWEQDIRRRMGAVGLARILDRFNADGRDFLALERPAGFNLWDVWDEPSYGPAERYGWLGQLADLLRNLHRAGAVVESLRPEQVRVTPLGQVVLEPTVVLLPLPLPRTAPIRPSPISAPELIDGLGVDARADLYCFGTVLYALELGHELTDIDFRGPGDPYQFLERFPDAHPFLGRLMSKSLARFREQRFPTAGSKEPTGFDELIATLADAQRVLNRARLEVAAWTSIGMIRPGNEDTLAAVHAAEVRDGVPEEYALVLAADGMGGNAAGEVASTMSVQSLRRHLLQQPPFRKLTDEPGQPRTPTDRAGIRRALIAALEEANRLVYKAAHEGHGRRGMGSTAEAVYIDGRSVIVGHVGDSRSYLLHRGRLTQLTKDHTVVARMVELGKLTPDQAKTHPRRGELRQAIGGRPDVKPALSVAAFVPGDWLVVCTDGLTGCLRPIDMQEILEQSSSADQAARRLVNRANQLGATDNVSVAVVRAS